MSADEMTTINFFKFCNNIEDVNKFFIILKRISVFIYEEVKEFLCSQMGFSINLYELHIRKLDNQLAVCYLGSLYIMMMIFKYIYSGVKPTIMCL